MKKLKKVFLFILILSTSGWGFPSCKKSDTVTPSNTGSFPAPISNIVSQGMVDSLRAAGATIHAGTMPPVVSGIFLMHPDSCIYDNSPGHNAGSLFDDYKFKFTDQNNTLFTVTVAQKNVVSGVINSTPVSSFVSGSGNDFSVFILRTLSPSGIVVQQFNVLSGTLTQNGIQNFQNTLYMRSKTGDPNNTIAPAGTVRVFVTGKPGLATISTTF